jgi:dTDP-4-dehydrorhamnose 3,5-epimerase
MPCKFVRLQIPDLILIDPIGFEDERGSFREVYKFSEFKKIGINQTFVQENHSKSKKGVLRGLHYQINPEAQGKLVCVIRGKIFDVAVDLRKGSPYYGKWAGAVLSEENRQLVWIPPGFAHGFVSLEDNTEVLYKATKEYTPKLDRGVLWNDPEIGVDWPVRQPMLSLKDSKLPPLKDAENNFTYGEDL